MSERAEVSFDVALMMALRADAQKELDELPTSAQLKERYPDTSRWDARLKAALHKRRPMLKRVLVAVLTLVILTLGALAVSADFRKAVYTMIQKFFPIEMQLTYQVDGEPLEQLPNGYSDHYVLDGFERDREQEFERAENFLHVYSSKESGKGYTVRCSIIQPGQQSSFDNEHTTYENIKVGDIGITDFELPGQDLFFCTGHHLLHDLYAPHELFRTGNVGFADIVPLCNLLADARFRRGGRNCVNLTQFLRGGFLGSSRVLVVAVSTGLPMFHTVLLSNEELLLLRG